MTNSGKFCENCGTALQDGSRFCEKCGQPVGAGGGASAPPAAAASPSGGTCPSCNQGDQVVSASAYDAAADPKVAGNDERADAEMVALFLAQPAKPQVGGVFLWALSAIIPGFVFFIYWFAPIHKGFKFFLFGWTLAFFASVTVPTLQAAQLYPFIGMLLLLFYWGALFIGRDSRKVEYLTRHIPEYNAMLARWAHLRYCKRCQRAWLDNVSHAPVGITDVESLLKG